MVAVVRDFNMIRGEVWWVSFEPSIGGQESRPAVIISTNASSKVVNRVQAVPITSDVSRTYPCEALVTLNGEPPESNGEPNRHREQVAAERASE